MIFASDLDQTLIYSRKSFGTQLPEKDIRLIEMKDGQEISFMTKVAISLLKDLVQKITFIPVTTRTVEQYLRIEIFQKEINPEFAITSNGGNILINGKIDNNWNNTIKKKIKQECLLIEDVIKEFNNIGNPTWVESSRIADDLFCYFIIERKNIPKDDLIHFQKWLSDNQWDLSVQGRKLYFTPIHLNKWDALNYIKSITGKDIVFAAGDSLLDYPMLTKAYYQLVPSHGELYNIYSLENKKHEMIFTKKSGIHASHEILKMVSDMCLKFNSPNI